MKMSFADYNKSIKKTLVLKSYASNSSFEKAIKTEYQVKSAKK